MEAALKSMTTEEKIITLGYSAADDYRRRRYEDFEKMREAYMAEEAEAISPYTFLMVLFALWGVIIALELVIAPYREATHQQITHHVPKTYSLERKHRYFSVATESIDCSLYIKLRLRVLHFLDDTIHPIHLTMRQAIMCISFLVPYSAVGINLSDPKKGGEQQPLDFIVPSRDMSERLGVFSDGREDASIRHIGLFGDGGVRYVLLPCAPHLSFRPEVIALMFPRAAKGLETTSLLTAFVVAAVLKADLDEPIGKKGLSSRDAEALFTYRMLTAQQLAYEALPSSAEWDNNTNLLFKIGIDLHLGECFGVVAFVRAGKVEETSGNENVLMQVSASGSLRTLEAVSSVTLRMLRLKEDPGKAIQAPSAFYDPCDEKFYCEDRASFFAIADRLHENHDLTCYPVPESEKHRDRVVMASTVRRSMLEYISAAVSQTPDALNHAAGF
ncbi:unnamed protein product [Heligmosomoides polygyrus]|uniref:PX domain-containing protein n=1 Tax=Heligmosomoides polygyrus TaxID=6339 RepID=A0A3P7XER9_HELPZ|nr:unnamed protein product [Heligmosomoides polygyrus]